MVHNAVGWHRPWLQTVESVVGHVAAIVIGFVMMIVGLGLGVTMIMLPVGLAIGLLGVAILLAGLFARLSKT